MADNPGTDAVADLLPHVAGSSHSHVGNKTSCARPAGGLSRMRGTGNGRNRYACRASTTGATAGRFGTHTRPTKFPEQVTS